jgi:hypothetical protein
MLGFFSTELPARNFQWLMARIGVRINRRTKYLAAGRDFVLHVPFSSYTLTSIA